MILNSEINIQVCLSLYQKDLVLINNLIPYIAMVVDEPVPLDLVSKMGWGEGIGLNHCTPEFWCFLRQIWTF